MKPKWLILGIALTAFAAVVVTLAVLGGIRLRQFVETSLLGPRRSAAFVQRGYEAMSNGQFDRAIREFTEAIRLNPQEPSTFMYRGFAYSSKSDWPRSIADFTEAVRLDPRNPEGFKYRAFSHLRLSEWDQAIADFSQVIQLNPDDAGAYGNRGLAHERKRRLDQALSDYNKSLGLDSNAPLVRAYRGQIWQQKGETAKAIEDFQASLALGATNAHTLNELAWMLATSPEASMRNGPVSVEAARQACELTQWKDWHCVDTLAAAYAEIGDYEQAVKYQKQCLTMPDLTAFYRPEAEQRLALFERQQPYREPTR